MPRTTPRANVARPLCRPPARALRRADPARASARRICPGEPAPPRAAPHVALLRPGMHVLAAAHFLRSCHGARPPCARAGPWHPGRIRGLCRPPASPRAPLHSPARVHGAAVLPFLFFVFLPPAAKYLAHGGQVRAPALHGAWSYRPVRCGRSASFTTTSSSGRWAARRGRSGHGAGMQTGQACGVRDMARRVPGARAGKMQRNHKLEGADDDDDDDDDDGDGGMVEAGRTICLPFAVSHCITGNERE